MRNPKTLDTISTSKHMKNSQNIMQKEINQYIKNKIIRYCSFQWKHHSLQLQIKVVTPTCLDPPSYDL